MPTTARELAWRLLTQLDGPGATLGDRLAAPEVETLSPRDRGFLHELLLGTLRRRGSLDHALAGLLDRPLDAVEPSVLASLRLGAYQILHMRVPARAAVSESVELARAHAPRAAGLVNAVLRRLAREGPRPFPDATSDPLGWLTTQGSLPLWLAERWLARLGPEASIARARAALEPPPNAYRLNPRVADAAARAEAEGLAPRALLFPGAFEATEGQPGSLAREGVLYLQDPASQLVGRLAGGPGPRLDACAAPGGKAMLMADLAGETGSVVAAEAAPRRLRLLAALTRRWGAANVWCVGADAARPPFRGVFDAVLLDAPCSGLGTVGRHPDIRWRVRPEDLSRHARRQAEMLRAQTPLVARGGLLVYATCSTEPEENEGVVEPFLGSRPDFRAEVPPWASSFADGAFLRTRPERDRSDGFFAAVLRRA